MKRRNFLKQSTIAAGALALPGFIQYFHHTDKEISQIRKMIMIHLKGGNDGYNTLIPYANPAYYEGRPLLAIPAEETIKLTSEHGLNPALGPLKELYQKGNILFVNSVAHETVEYSHHNALKIWHTGYPDTVNEKYPKFLNVDTNQPYPVSIHENEYMAYTAADFGQGLQKITEAIKNGSDTQIYHISLDGFDTHQMQRQRHDNLLSVYAETVQTLVQKLTDMNAMDDTLILTYSEFGRTIKENNKRGTEHGNENCLWIIGTKLKSKGIYSNPVSSAPVCSSLIKNWLKVRPAMSFDETDAKNWV